MMTSVIQKGIASGHNYAGTWNLLTGTGVSYTVTLVQNGNSVNGTFAPHSGRIDGTIGDDGRLIYRWSDDTGSTGAGIFSISNGQLNGTFGLSQNPNDVAGTWSGQRNP